MVEIRSGSEASLKDTYRHMFGGLRDKAGHLDETICRLGEHLVAKHGHKIDEEAAVEAQDFFQAAPDTFPVVGRICCDASDVRINVESILLQGSQDLCRGRMLPFDEKEVPEYSLFPGQVVLAEATNPTGRKVHAKKLFADASPTLNPTANRDRARDHSLDVVVAAGPFTTSDNLDYEPLDDFLAYLAQNKPHVAIMIGPFVDAGHEKIASCDTGNKTYNEIFRDVMMKIIKTIVPLTSTRVIMVPSPQDVHHKSVYPTPPFPASQNADVRDKIFMASDPDIIDIDGVTFGLTSTDILFHLGKEELCKPRSSGDRLRRLAGHLLQQRSFYPLFPPQEDMNIDFEMLEKHARIESQPHVLILPSDLLHFYKEANGGILLNPGRLTKREGGGVFARFKIQKANAEEQEFSKRVVGDIVRI